METPMNELHGHYVRWLQQRCDLIERSHRLKRASLETTLKRKVESDGRDDD
jgi:hypothetical protein